MPQRHPDNPSLGRWVYTQRYEFRKLLKGQHSRITNERIQLLNNLSFDWEVTGGGKFQPCDDLWNFMFGKLQGYFKQNGHSRVPHNYSPDLSLGQWVSTQRTAYRKLREGKASFMTVARIKALEKVNFEWKVKRGGPAKPDHDGFAASLRLLQEFKNKNGHCRVPYRFRDNPTLGQWVSTQRKEFKKLKHGKPSRLSKERIEALEALSFEWSAAPANKNKCVEKKPSNVCPCPTNGSHPTSTLDSNSLANIHTHKSTSSHPSACSTSGGNGCDQVKRCCTPRIESLDVANKEGGKERPSMSWKEPLAMNEKSGSSELSVDENPGLCWVCDVCKVAYFETYKEAIHHESLCMMNRGKSLSA